MRALSKGQRAIVRKDVKKMASDPALRAAVERVLFCAVMYDRAQMGEGRELTDLACAANEFANAFYRRATASEPLRPATNETKSTLADVGPRGLGPEGA